MKRKRTAPVPGKAAPVAQPPAAVPHPPILCPECKAGESFMLLGLVGGLSYGGEAQFKPDGVRYRCQSCTAEFTISQEGVLNHGRKA